MTEWFADQIVKELYASVLHNISEEKGFSATWGLFFDFLRVHEQTATVQGILRNIEMTYFSFEDGQGSENNPVIGAVATLLSEITEVGSSSEPQIRAWLTTGHGNTIKTVGLRRALMLRYSSDEGGFFDTRFRNAG